MNISITESWYEKKYRQNGIDFPIHCILMNVPKHEQKTITPHYHEYIEILYSIESDCDVYLNNTFRKFKTGDLLIINSGENHTLIFPRSDAHYIVIKVLPEILYSSDQSVFEMKYTIPFLIKNSKNKRHFTKEELGDNYIHDTVTRIIQEWQMQDYGYELSMRSDVLKVFLWVLRYWRGHNLDAVDQFDYSDEILRIIQSSLEYISHNYAAITEQEVAEHCNLSYSYFSRTFKKVMHQSFSEYLTHYRITKAEQLLFSTNKTITEISELVGFSTPSYFIQQFKAKKNISPKQYRINFTREN